MQTSLHRSEPSDWLPDEGLPLERLLGGLIKRRAERLGSVEPLAAAMEEQGIGAASKRLVPILVNRAADADDLAEEDARKYQQKPHRSSPAA
ncbi:hypothetical protein CDL15_Pgr007654 [Punica granatum]|uniref:Uncharacterized protein n=1 Tax=Punica granatum TaxID=22663 RepID=A0A218XAA2_PUNGR|nr:hypothetical protein CDL15_Pgr007654 [Punica granatum]